MSGNLKAIEEPVPFGEGASGPGDSEGEHLEGPGRVWLSRCHSGEVLKKKLVIEVAGDGLAGGVQAEWCEG